MRIIPVIQNIAVVGFLLSSVSCVKLTPREPSNSISTQGWKNLKGSPGMDCFSPKEQKIYTAGQKSIRDSLARGIKKIKPAGKRI